MPRYEIVSATPEHAAHVAQHMRHADVEEVWAASHKTPTEALEAGMVSCDTKAGIADGEPICLFGVVSVGTLLRQEGLPWLLGTDKIRRYARPFLLASRGFMDEAAEQYPHMFNYVDARNADAIKWLGWLGFSLSSAQPYGAEGLPFHKFEMGE